MTDTKAGKAASQGRAKRRIRAARTGMDPADLFMFADDDDDPAALRRHGIAECQRLLDSPDPRLAALKAQFIAEINITVDTAEKRVAALVDAEAQRSRKTFTVVDGGRPDRAR